MKRSYYVLYHDAPIGRVGARRVAEGGLEEIFCYKITLYIKDRRLDIHFNFCRELTV